MKKAACLLLFHLSVLLLLLVCSASAETLVLPMSVEEIEAEAFCDDTCLDIVVLPEGIRKIGDRAFANSSLRQINLPDNLEYISPSAFQNSSLVFVTANSGSYGYEWAVGNGYISEHEGDYVTTELNDGTLSITGYTGCYATVYIPANIGGKIVTDIAGYAFKNHSEITKIVIPAGVCSIQNYAFSGCNNITRIELPDNISSTG